ncbi:hypothetical protein [Paenibacillus campinasensis]|uniref:hypothetical protein n=1 Tax=Paenibacillus campinasensis TaxID=66347 RepID=UPI0015C9E711|nr:hypothetical protein [Paenibacillus campinasensis]
MECPFSPSYIKMDILATKLSRGTSKPQSPGNEPPLGAAAAAQLAASEKLDP